MTPYADYPQYPQIWAPPMMPLLFVVKVPRSLHLLDESSYKTLMQQRLDWMIQRWMEEMHSSPIETQQLLSSTLLKLAPAQQTPQIETDEDILLTQWRQDWAETLILYTERFSEALWMLGMNQMEFPTEPFNETYPEFQALLALHQEIHLEEWLTTLIP